MNEERTGYCKIPHEVGVEIENTMVKRNNVKSKNNDLQNITYKTKDRVTRTPYKTWGGASGAPEG